MQKQTNNPKTRPQSKSLQRPRKDFELPQEFSTKAITETAEIAANTIQDFKTEIPLRRDCRNVPTFTIDPATAQDFDDAISVQKLPGGKIELGVHIADVSHYVKEGTALDKEAALRATSIYLVGQTIPMLPEVLSNDLCSLKPNVDRLAFSAIFTFDPNYHLQDEWFGRTVICSRRRFTYEEAQKVLEAGQGDMATELRIANAIAQKLRQDKSTAGAIAFEDPEVIISLDESGQPTKIVKKVPIETNHLVEDLMLLANRRVAEFVSRLTKHKPQTFVYRIHDNPDMEKIEDLMTFLKPLGYELKIAGDKIQSREINRLLKAVTGTSEEGFVNRAAIRSMAKAVYSMHNVGHYGLAFRYYTHFTSPIRRYPDIMVHRLLNIYLSGKKPKAELIRHYGKLVLHSTEREILASIAERSSIKEKQVLYFAGKIGEERTGTIAGVTDFGLFVEDNETMASGLVHVKNLGNEWFSFNEKSYELIGRNSGRRYRLGDKVKFRVLAADPKRATIDFELV